MLAREGNIERSTDMMSDRRGGKRFPQVYRVRGKVRYITHAS
jgi:hypothetical protein